MFSFRRVAFLLAMSLPALHVLQAQDSTSSSATPAAQEQTQQPAADQSQGEQSVQARIRARRAQRRAQAIRDTYMHLYEVYAGAGFQRTKPGPNLEKLAEYSWNTGLTRYFNERLGATLDARGYYGTAYVGLNTFNITRPSISQYDVLFGPTYRLVVGPKYSMGVRGEGGMALGDFSGDTSGASTQSLGLFQDATTYALDGQLYGEANVSPNLALRLAGDYFATGFSTTLKNGSSYQNGFGFNVGVVYRFGKQ